MSFVEVLAFVIGYVVFATSVGIAFAGNILLAIYVSPWALLFGVPLGVFVIANGVWAFIRISDSV